MRLLKLRYFLWLLSSLIVLAVAVERASLIIWRRQVIRCYKVEKGLWSEDRPHGVEAMAKDPFLKGTNDAGGVELDMVGMLWSGPRPNLLYIDPRGTIKVLYTPPKAVWTTWM
ncbi:MAG: hypothetical protein P8018_08480 [Acidobacteriota bacterium]